MALSIHLALTAWEYQHSAPLPEHPAWMACHFSSYGAGLSNIPDDFPTGGLLMVNDRIPPAGHSPELIVQQLLQAADRLCPKGIILDFQRPFHKKTYEIAESILSCLPCPVAVTEPYCQNWNGAVFLPPMPPGKKAEAHLEKWRGRDIWLEVTKTGEQLVLTEEGCKRYPMSQLPGMPVFREEKLFCHYSMDITDKRAVFSLWRTDEDLTDMLKNVQTLGVSTAVGLYQEFC